jgi:uncharacterized membrane-anchored protein YitT (DUF2179 family)
VKNFNLKKNMIDILLIVIGNLMLAIAVHTFILPYEILSGGVAGIAVALSKITGYRSDLIISVLIWVLFAFGAFFLGRKFTIHTISSSILYPLFLNLLNTQPIQVSIDPILASLYGGLVAGFGVGLVFRTGASTGGMDVPPLIIHKFTNIELSKLVLAVDLLTVTLGVFVYGIEPVLMGFISVWASAFAIKQVLVFGGQEARSVMIITNSVDEVVDMIDKKLERGATLLSAHGGYTRESRSVILSVINMTQYPELITELHLIDPHAFVIATEAMEVKGNGFSFDYKV